MCLIDIGNQQTPCLSLLRAMRSSTTRLASPGTRPRPSLCRCGRSNDSSRTGWYDMLSPGTHSSLNFTAFTACKPVTHLRGLPEVVLSCTAMRPICVTCARCVVCALATFDNVCTHCTPVVVVINAITCAGHHLHTSPNERSRVQGASSQLHAMLSWLSVR